MSPHSVALHAGYDDFALLTRRRCTGSKLIYSS
jgi:hypothetical protein